MNITSPAFDDGEEIPAKYTCDGENINPPLALDEVPEQTVSMALIIEDIDTAGGFTHWLVWNIDPQTVIIEEDEIPPDAEEGINDYGEVGYGGPCPPSTSAGTHHYRFRIYALDEHLDIPPNTSKEELLRIISDHAIDQDEMVGLYGETTETIATSEEDGDEI